MKFIINIMRTIQLFLVAILVLLSTSCDNSIEVFNGENLDNWDKHIGPPLDGFEELAAQATTDNVFSIVEEGGEKLIRISGTVKASLATKQVFENYHLVLAFKWGDEVYTRQNSGLLYHSFGEFGKALETWMTNIECQLLHGSMGDTYLMNNTYCETSTILGDNKFIYSSNGELLEFGRYFMGPVIGKAKDAENPVGEWNIIELYSVGRTTVHVVNGAVTMVNTNTGIFENDEVSPLSSGKIQLQSEGGELFVKSMTVTPISKIPSDLLK